MVRRGYIRQYRNATVVDRWAATDIDRVTILVLKIRSEQIHTNPDKPDGVPDEFQAETVVRFCAYPAVNATVVY